MDVRYKILVLHLVRITVILMHDHILVVSAEQHAIAKPIKTHDDGVATANAYFQIVYWSTKPYVYADTAGRMVGIVPEALNLLEHYCPVKKHYTKFVEYKLELDSMNLHLQLLHSNISYGEGALKDVKRHRAIWFPYIHGLDVHDLHLMRKRNLTAKKLFSIKRLAVIALEEKIYLLNKVFMGLYNCIPMTILLVAFTFLFSFIIWFIERTKNDKISKSFVKGSSTSLWLTIVTFVTVGYGDIVPKTVVVKTLMSLWMVFGLVMAAIITATITDTINSDTHLSIYGKTISVLKNSYEQIIIRHTYTKDIILTKEYMTALELVRSRQAFAAVIDGEIASWYQDLILDPTRKPALCIVREIPIDVPLSILTNNKDENADIFRCMKEYWDEIITTATGKYKKELLVETLHYPEIMRIFENKFCVCLLYLTAAVFVVGIAFDVFQYFNKSEVCYKNKCEATEI